MVSMEALLPPFQKSFLTSPAWMVKIRLSGPRSLIPDRLREPTICYPNQETWTSWLERYNVFLNPEEWEVEALRHRQADMRPRQALNARVRQVLEWYQLHQHRRPYLVHLTKRRSRAVHNVSNPVAERDSFASHRQRRREMRSNIDEEGILHLHVNVVPVVQESIPEPIPERRCSQAENVFEGRNRERVQMHRDEVLRRQQQQRGALGTRNFTGGSGSATEGFRWKTTNTTPYPSGGSVYEYPTSGQSSRGDNPQQLIGSEGIDTTHVRGWQQRSNTSASITDSMVWTANDVSRGFPRRPPPLQPKPLLRETVREPSAFQGRPLNAQPPGSSRGCRDNGNLYGEQQRYSVVKNHSTGNPGTFGHVFQQYNLPHQTSGDFKLLRQLLSQQPQQNLPQEIVQRQNDAPQQQMAPKGKNQSQSDHQNDDSNSIQRNDNRSAQSPPVPPPVAVQPPAPQSPKPRYRKFYQKHCDRKGKL